MNVEQEIKGILVRLEKIEKFIFSGEQDLKDIKTSQIDFDLGERAFINQYVKGLNGQKCFAWIVVYLTKGKIDEVVNITQITRMWGRCSGVLGKKYRSTFATRCKNEGWVDNKENKKNLYVLKKKWKEIFKENE